MNSIKYEFNSLRDLYNKPTWFVHVYILQILRKFQVKWAILLLDIYVHILYTA